MKVYLEKELITDNIVIANTFYLRLRGLMFKKNISNDAGLFLTPCNGVHTFFMRFNIDVVYLDGANKILKVFYDVPPWRMLPMVKGCRAVLETTAGLIPENVIHKDFQIA